MMTFSPRRTLAAVLAAGLLGASPAFAAEKYEFDPSHSSVNFSVLHMMVSKVRGKFNQFEGTLLYDEKDLTKSKVEGVIKSSSIDTANAKRDDHLKSADFFDTAKHPTITFKSTRIEKKGNGFVAIGPLTMRGVTKEVQIPFTITGKVKNKGKGRIGIEANLTLNRHDFGVSWSKTMDNGGLVVANEVEIQLVGEAVQP